MRGSAMSSANSVCPVHLARASTLRNGLPTTLRSFRSLRVAALFFLLIAVDAFFGWLCFFAAHARRREFDRFVNLDVAGTAAKIAGERFLDLIARRQQIALEQLFRGEQEAGRTVSALRRAK